MSRGPDAQGREPARFGSYEVVERLGGGGFGEVFRARHPALGTVALKVLRADRGVSLRQFVRERSLVLDHPAVPRILDHGEVEGSSYLVQELVEGRPLSSVVCDGVLGEEQALEIAAQIADVLAFAHDRGLVHRDLKPDNVLLGDDGRVHVLDFGIARHAALPDLAPPGLVMGTPAYLSPEQARGDEVGPASDLYSLGVLLSYLVTGRLPHRAESVVAMSAAIASVPPEPLNEARGDLSAAFLGLVRRLLEKEPARRPPSARAVAAEVERVRAGTGGLAGILAGAEQRRGALLLFTGDARSLAVEELRRRAEERGFTVRRGTVKAHDSVHRALESALGSPPLPGAPSRGQVLAAWRRTLAAAATAGPPLLLIVDDLHLADDGTWDAIEAMASAAAALPAAIAVTAPGKGDGSFARWVERLAAAGKVVSLPVGARAPLPPAPGFTGTAGDAFDLAREAARRHAPRVADEMFGRALRGNLDDDARTEALLGLASLARESHDHAEAERLLGRAADVRGERRLRWLMEHGLLDDDRRRLPDARRWFEAALGEAEASGSDAALASACMHLGVVHWRTGDHAAARALCERAAALAPGSLSGARAIANSGMVIWETEKHPDAVARVETGLAWARAAEDPLATCRCLLTLGSIHDDRGEARMARRCQEEALALARELPDRRLLGKVLANLANRISEDEETEAALARYLEVLGIAGELGDDLLAAVAYNGIGLCRVRLEQYAEASACYEHALALRRKLGDPYGVAMTELNQGIVAHQRGSCGEARALFESALSVPEAVADPRLRAHILLALGHCMTEGGLAAGPGHLEEARALGAAVPLRDVEAQSHIYLAEHVSAHDPVAALGHAREAMRIAEAASIRPLFRKAVRLLESLGGGR